MNLLGTVGPGFSIPLTSVSAWAASRSYICCGFNQNSGRIPRARQTLSTVSAVMALLLRAGARSPMQG